MSKVIKGNFGEANKDSGPIDSFENLRKKTLRYLYDNNVRGADMLQVFSPLFERPDGFEIFDRKGELSVHAKTPKPFEVQAIFDAMAVIFDLSEETGETPDEICQALVGIRPAIMDSTSQYIPPEWPSLSDDQKEVYTHFIETGENTRDNLSDEEQYCNRSAIMTPFAHLALDGPEDCP